MKPTVLIYEPATGNPQRKVLGLTLRDRLEKACMRDGAREVLALDESTIGTRGPVVLCPSTLVAERKVLRALLHEKAEPQALLTGGAPVVRLGAQDRMDAELLADPEVWLESRAQDAVAPDGFARTIDDKRAARAAENALLQALRKPVDGLISRTLNRPVSLATSRLLARTPATPNHITIGAGILGLIGAGVMAQGGYLALAFGAFLVHMSSVFDGCDGEIARLKFQSSRIGEWLDTVTDDVVNASMTLGLGLGISATTGSSVYAVLSIVAVVLHLSYAGVVYHYLITQARTGFALDFKWWFEDGNTQANTFHDKMSVMDTLKLMVRRDFFVFLFFVLCAVNVPVVALAFASAGAVVVFVLGVLQTVMTRLPARQAAQRRTRA